MSYVQADKTFSIGFGDDKNEGVGSIIEYLWGCGNIVVGSFNLKNIKPLIS